MDVFSPKERLLKTFHKEKTERPPVICPGGMMNAAIVDIMNKTGHRLPEAHKDSKLMAALSEDVNENTGFENLGLPFCMTVEAEALGSDINFGSFECEPKIQKEVYSSVEDVEFKPIKELEKYSRLETIIQAGYILSKRNPDIPVIANLTGPISTTASIVDPITFLKELRKKKEGCHRVLEYVTDFLIDYAKLMISNGATAISIGDPTSTGEILGPKMFREYAVPYINKVVDAIHEQGAPVIVHICGNMNTVRDQIPDIRSDAISTDALVNLKLLKEDYPSLTTMGNLSTFLLQFGNPESVAKQTVKLVNDGINIISPACGLSTSTSLSNISALTNAVKEK